MPKCNFGTNNQYLTLFGRNKARFSNRKVPWKTAISLVVSRASVVGDITKKTSTSSMRYFDILKAFEVSATLGIPG